MFNILNSVGRLRNYSPLVCKILDIVTKLFHARPPAAGRRSYLLELYGLRNNALAANGLPIALPLQPALMHFGKGKG